MALPRLVKSFGRPQPDGIKQALASWFDTELGNALLDKQSAMLEKVLPQLFGYHVLYSGFEKLNPVIENSPIRHKVFLENRQSQLRSNIHNLPFKSDSSDLVVLHHSLDLEQDPFQVLREATRVVLPSGKLLIIGFNPWSLWGLWRNLLFRSVRAPWSARFISPYRLAEWLDILGFDVEGVESAFYMPPVASLVHRDSGKWLEQFGSAWFAQRGAFYVLLANKRVSCITPVRLRRKALRPKVIPVAVSGKVIPFNDQQ